MKNEMKSGKTAVIITGGALDAPFVLERIKFLHPDLVVGADRGCAFCLRHGIPMDIVLGDFDSFNDDEFSFSFTEDLESEIRKAQRRPFTFLRYPVQKDWTDTELALDCALKAGSGDIHIFGATGTRLDHVLGNVFLLKKAAKQGTACALEDPYCRVTLHEHSFDLAAADQWGKYISFFAVGGDVENLTLEGFAYPVTSDTLSNGSTRFLSNELKGGTGHIRFEKGRLLMIESRD